MPVTSGDVVGSLLNTTSSGTTPALQPTARTYDISLIALLLTNLLTAAAAELTLVTTDRPLKMCLTLCCSTSASPRRATVAHSAGHRAASESPVRFPVISTMHSEPFVVSASSVKEYVCPCNLISLSLSLSVCLRVCVSLTVVDCDMCKGRRHQSCCGENAVAGPSVTALCHQASCHQVSVTRAEHLAMPPVCHGPL